MNIVNLGQVSTIKIGSTPPVNLKLLWYDTAGGVGGSNLKYYNLNTLSWVLLSTISTEPGPKGDDGREIELRKTVSDVQWKYISDTVWINLFSLVDLKGSDGSDGKNIELQKSATHIQWRLVDGTVWTDLVALIDLKGDAGQGMASGGLQNTFLKKSSGADFDTKWEGIVGSDLNTSAETIPYWDGSAWTNHNFNTAATRTSLLLRTLTGTAKFNDGFDDDDGVTLGQLNAKLEEFGFSVFSVNGDTGDVILTSDNINSEALGLGSTITDALNTLNNSKINAGGDNATGNLLDAINKRHSHANITVLEEIEEPFTFVLKQKVDGIANQATKNDTDANLKNRANHVGTQSISTIDSLQLELDGKVSVDGVKQLSDENFTTALKATYDDTVVWVTTNEPVFINHLTDTQNPHNVTKDQLDLDQVNNTSDLSKPISNPTKLYADALVSDQNTSSGVGQVKFWTGTQLEYDTITTKDPATIYYIRA